MPSDKRKCLECQGKVSGRIDKKFCSDQCRTSWNNKRNSDQSNLMRNINNILRRNRRILAALNTKGKTKISKQRLIESGLRLNYFTNEFVTSSGKVYRYCYEQGYTQLDENTFFLIIREDYVD